MHLYGVVLKVEHIASTAVCAAMSCIFLVRILLVGNEILMRRIGSMDV